jgi:hypothetical protein
MTSKPEDRAATYHQFADSEIKQSRGRFDQAEERPHLAGQEPLVRYPQASGPWQGPDPVGDEPPLGFSVDQVEPIETSAVPLVEVTDAPDGATAAADNLPPASADKSGDTGASLCSNQKLGDPAGVHIASPPGTFMPDVDAGSLPNKE